MAQLTEDEITRIRQLIGDDTVDTQDGGFDLTDPQIQYEWDRADGHASEQAEHLALYNMLRRRRGIWLKLVDSVSETSPSLQNQKLRNIERLLDDERELAGIGAFTLSTQAGVLDFGIDQEEETEG